MAKRGRPPKNTPAGAGQPNEPQVTPAVSVSGAAEKPVPALPDVFIGPLQNAEAIPELAQSVAPVLTLTSSQDEISNMSEEQEKITGTVTIGCKLPCGLVMTFGGKSVELRGSRDSRILNGYGLTNNVDAEFWEAWKKAHAKLPYVKNELVFAYKDKRSAQDMAEERQKERTGMEGLDPDKPGKDLKPVPDKKNDDEDDDED